VDIKYDPCVWVAAACLLLVCVMPIKKQTNEGPTGWYQSIYIVSATRTRDSFV
jgi:hypothetical protein